MGIVCMCGSEQIVLPESCSPALAASDERDEAVNGASIFRRYEETVRRMLILVALYSIPAAVVMRPVDDYDIWWHLRTGQWIIQNGAVPSTDPFSSFGQGKAWVAYSWLFEVMIYQLHQAFGLWGILLYRIVLTFAIVLSVHHLVAKREPRFVVATGLVGSALSPIAGSLTERTWLFTILFFTLTLEAILNLRAGRRTPLIWLLPFLYVLWANVHIQFIYGLLLLGLACLCPVVDRALGWGRRLDHPACAGSSAWWRLMGLALACFLATLMTPYHVRLYTVVVDLAGQTGVNNVIGELLPMSFRTPEDWILLALMLAAAFALGRRPRHRLSSFDATLLIAGAYFSFRTHRDAWFAVLASLTILVTGQRSETPPADQFHLNRLRLLTLAVVAGVVLAVIGWMRGLSPKHLREAVGDRFPAGAAAFIEKQAYGGSLYNHYDWGGYLIWRLPDLRVAMDGRANLHGDERILRSIKTWEGAKGWDSDPELDAEQLVIAPSQIALASLLRLDTRYDLVYEDKIAAVFVAKTAKP